MIIFFLMLASGGYSQYLFLDIGSGATTGWWVYNKGSATPGVLNDQGYDRTHHSLFLPFHGSVNLRKGPWSIGVVAEHVLMFEDIMYRDDDRAFSPERYPIADQFVKFWKFGLQTEWAIVDHPRFSLSPQLKLGSFLINTIHPEKDNFGFRWFFEVGAVGEIRFNDRYALNLCPVYQSLHLSPKTPKFTGERHQMLAFGMDVALRIFLVRN